MSRSDKSLTDTDSISEFDPSMDLFDDDEHDSITSKESFEDDPMWQAYIDPNKGMYKFYLF